MFKFVILNFVNEFRDKFVYCCFLIFIVWIKQMIQIGVEVIYDVMINVGVDQGFFGVYEVEEVYIYI